MKKYIAIFLALIFIGCFPLTATAQETEFSITAEETSAVQGEQVAVKFIIANNPGISLFTLSIDYDKTKLSLKELNGNPLMGGSFINNIEEDFVLWISSSKDSHFNGTVFTAVFEVAPNSPKDKTEVSVLLPNDSGNVLNYNGDDLEIKVVSGYVDIEGTVLYGDTNCDGEINSLDMVKMKSVLMSGGNAESYACDVNDDGTIDARDLVRLKKILVTI